ncbi:MAG: HAD-IC family P-type ATPase [Gammaproteobacteria bacterium]
MHKVTDRSAADDTNTGDDTRRFHKRFASVVVEALHTRVPGRARIHINVLYRQPAFEPLLVKQLSAFTAIHSTQANVRTGNVLIRYDRETPLGDILILVRKATHRAITSAQYAKQQPVKIIRKHEEHFTNDIITLVKEQLESFREHAPSGPRPARHPPSRSAQRSPPHSPPQSSTKTDWHTNAVNKVITGTATDLEHGLSLDEAARRLQRYGLNELPRIARRSQLAILMEQFMTVPVGLLAASAVVSAATGGLVDAGVIMSVVAINAGIGFFTERQAEQTISALTKPGPRYARVLRGGKLHEVPHSEVTIGDVLLLSPGDFVAADGRILKSQRFTVDESALTGESVPVRKSAEYTAKPDTPLAERFNMVYKGTMVTGGNAVVAIVAVGVDTEIGQIQSLVGEARSPETPMQIQLGKIGTQLAVISSAVCVGVFAIGLLRGQSFLQMLKSSISLAVAAVPEGLPTVATTTLALGIRNMHRHNVAIRHLNAVETLGSVQVLCLDKTGTLTLNKMRVLASHVGLETAAISEYQFVVDGDVIDPLQQDEYVRLLQVSALCNESEDIYKTNSKIFNGSPTENALVELAVNAGVDVAQLHERYPRYKTRYRSEERPYMCTCHKIAADTQLVAVKGSPQQVLALCQWYLKGGKKHVLNDRIRHRIIAANDSMASDALRVLGIAFAEHDLDEKHYCEQLTWLGLVGMIDPLRTGMTDLIHTFHEAGIHTMMITGDQAATAYAIGKQLKLSEDEPLQILDSTRLDKLDPQLLKGLVDRIHVFARVSPAHKLKIVQALQQSGKVVAMTGDGINDGPALKAANIGVAMGGATTDVARSVSDVVLEDDNLHTMSEAVHQGRTIYNNIRKTIHYLISTNLSEIEVMLAGVSLGAGQTLNPMQLLWINLVTDIFPGLALSMEAAEPDIMQQPPREPDEEIIQRKDLYKMARESAIITGGSLASYAYGALRYGPGPRANTLLFNTLTVTQLVHAYSTRSEHYSVFSKKRLPRNHALDLAAGGSLALQVLAMTVPGLRNLLGSTPLGLLDLLVIGGGVSAPFFVNEFIKETTRDRQRDILDNTNKESDKPPAKESTS